MREIKFRAWDGERMMYRGLFDRNWYTESKGGLCIDGIHPNDRNRLKVGEFTGLTDKNGKEIYEGDVVNFKTSQQSKQDEFYETKRRVFFHRGGFGFEEWHTDEHGNLKERLTHHAAHFTTPDLYYIDFDLEIIGNIHENPELLK